MRAAFEKFRLENPHVERSLIRLIEQYRDGGASHVSIRHLWEIMRRDAWLQTKGDLWKLNNSFTGYYARLIVRLRPDLADMFERRRMVGELTDLELELARMQTDAFPEMHDDDGDDVPDALRFTPDDGKTET